MEPAGATTGRSPGFARNPDYEIRLIPAPERVSVVVGGETVADSTRARVMLEAGHPPVYYFPRADVRMDLLRRTDHRTHCPYKGDASYWTIAVGDRVLDDAVWAYETPYAEMAELRDYVAFYWDRVDAVFVGGERVE